MKLFSALLSVSFVSSLVLACASAPQTPAKVTPRSLDLEGRTVALYTKDTDSPRCTGVWVGDARILTAAHCVSDDELDPLFYSTYSEYIGVTKTPNLHSMALIREDKDVDLALYETGVFDTPKHPNATVAPRLLDVGADIHVMGHTAGLSYSYMHGYVAFYRELDFRPDKKGPWLQISAPIYKGNSGGGAYNDMGELVGIASFMASKIPNVGFFVYSGTIRNFLAAKP